MTEFDIRTTDTAYGFLLKFLQMRPNELIIEYLVNCERDCEQFWNRNFSKIDQADISNIRFIGFHITSNWDNCDEIRKQKSKSYKITFYANLSQPAPFSFDMNNLDDPPYDDWYDLTPEQRLKKKCCRLHLTVYMIACLNSTCI